MINLFAIILTLTASISTFARTRTLVFEFEPVVGATRYDIEFRQMGSQTVFKEIKTAELEIEITLPFHHYEYRQRTLDKRKIAGSWSHWEKFDVTIPELKIVSPMPDTLIDTNEDKTQNVKFNWSGAEGIEEFEISVIDLNTQKEIEKVQTKKTTVDVEVPVASQYEFTVRTVLPEEIPADLKVEHKIQFGLLAKSLENPKIEPVKNLYSQKVSWKPVEWAQNYQVTLLSYSPEAKKWEALYTQKDVTENELQFDPKWRGGKYRIRVAANGNLRKPSSVSTESFSLASVRTPAAEYSALLFKTIDRVDGYFTQVSWMMTELNLQSFSFDTSTYASAQPVGGALSASLGYFKSRQPWGMFGTFSTSQMMLNNEIKGFSKIDISGMYRHKFLERDELRASVGLSQKEIPVIVGNSQSRNFYVHNSEVKGPKFAFEYWFALGPKWGLQANYNQNLYNLLSNSSAPNGNRLYFTESFQAGFMTSYQFSEKIAGLIGLTHQEDNYVYEPKQTGTGMLPSGATNRGKLKADYIGLMVEIGL